MVLMPNTPKGGGISRKIFNSSDRNKIRSILNEIQIPKTMGVIVRTAGANKTRNEIEKDFQNTLNTWGQIKDKAVSPMLLHLFMKKEILLKEHSEIFMIMTPKVFSLMVMKVTRKQNYL